MPSTFIQLTNRLLRRLNEVEISQTDFTSVRGIQSTAKDCILDTVREINTAKIDWPFNAVEHSQNLSVGVEEYGWPNNFTAVDWNSFQIQKDGALNINHKRLKPIMREEWYDNLRDSDYDAEGDGKNIPIWVFPSHGQGFGVSPSPNEAYPIKYRYYKNPDDLELFDDEVTIPNKFDYVIIAGALFHLNQFKENMEGAQLAKVSYDAGMKNMRNTFLPNAIYMYGTQVNFGGGQWQSAGFYWGEPN